MDRVIDYYLAPQSPWTFLGHTRFVALARDCGAAIRVWPVDLARIFPATGGVQLLQRPKERQSYRLLELARWSEELGMPLNLQPKFFPVASNDASRRIVAAATTFGSDRALDLALATHRAVWIEERDIADAATLDAIAAACGFDAAALGELAASPDVHARYEANTTEALAEEIFGAPTYIPRFGPAKDQRFWGQDRLDALARALAT
jgi:2-hydroxychromene-2-carboxylate isomerase